MQVGEVEGGVCSAEPTVWYLSHNIMKNWLIFHKESEKKIPEDKIMHNI